MSDRQKIEKDDNPVQNYYDSKLGESADVDLAKAEKDAGKTDGQDTSAVSSAESQGLYSPNTGKGGSGKSSTSSKFKAAFSGRKKYGWMGGSTAVIITLVVYSFTIISGPFQFIHLSQQLDQNFASLNLMSSRRIGAHIRSYQWGGKNPYIGSRLGTIGNRIANGVETKLNKGGIELITSPDTGVLKGVKVDGITVAEFNDGETNKFRRDVTKAEISEKMGWNKATTALMTRLPFARYDVSLRVFGNIKRGVDEKIDAYADRLREEKEKRISDKTFDYEASQKRIDELEVESE